MSDIANNPSRKQRFPWDEALDWRNVRWRKAVNTYLRMPFLWNLIISDADFAYILDPENSPKSNLRRLVDGALRRAFWFWPRVSDAVAWTEMDPEHYREMQDDSRILVNEVAARAPGSDAPILDLGCNCGRHLDALAKMGFSNLYGVDVSAKAVEVMTDWFPRLRKNCTVEVDFFQRFLRRIDDRHFDIVFSRGATVELVHPSFPLVDEICRVTDGFAILVISENTHVYPRYWIREFERNGFMLVKLVRPLKQLVDPDDYVGSRVVSLMVFYNSNE